MSTLTLEAAAFLPPQDQVEFYLNQGRHYRKLAADALAVPSGLLWKLSQGILRSAAVDADNRK